MSLKPFDYQGIFILFHPKTQPFFPFRGTSSTCPHAPIFWPATTTIPNTPWIRLPKAMAGLISRNASTRLPMAVAAASARAQERAIHADGIGRSGRQGMAHRCRGSAQPDTIARPAPERPVSCFNGELPAKSPATTGASVFKKISPPFSTTTWRLWSSSSRPTDSATAPATDAMGPTPAALPASNHVTNDFRCNRLFMPRDQAGCKPRVQLNVPFNVSPTYQHLLAGLAVKQAIGLDHQVRLLADHPERTQPASTNQTAVGPFTVTGR
jgi:hypothetical protein